MIELNIIKVLLNKEYYNKFYNSIHKVSVETETKKLINTIKDYYNTYSDHEYIDPEELEVYFFLENKGIAAANIWKDIFTQLKTIKVSDSLAADIIRTLIERDIINKIVNISLPVLEGQVSDVLPQIETIISTGREALALQDETEEAFISDDLDSLIATEVEATGLSWRLACLNQSLGPLRANGTMIHVFARTDVGKTTFIHSELSHFATQLVDNECGLWFNNEGSQNKLRLRWYSAVLGRELDRILDNRGPAAKYFASLGGKHIKLVRKTTLSVYDVESYIKQYTPKFVVLDVADKIKFIDGKVRTDEKLQMLYQRYREIGLKYSCDIITVGQASVEASGKQYLIEDWMHNSKTGKPMELDVAIGIGCTDKDSIKRYISLPKNKMRCNKPSKYVVRIDKACARFYDLGV